MSFPSLLKTISSRSQSPEERNDATHSPETQPLIEHEPHFPDDTKQEPDTQPNIIRTPEPYPPPSFNVATAEHVDVDYPQLQLTEGSIRLGSPAELGAAPSGNGLHVPRFSTMRPENRTIADDMTRGLLLFVTTPIAFIGMLIYACGTFIEGIALMLKGVGSLGSRALMRRRGGSQSPETQWV